MCEKTASLDGSSAKACAAATAAAAAAVFPLLLARPRVLRAQARDEPAFASAGFDRILELDPPLPDLQETRMTPRKNRTSVPVASASLLLVSLLVSFASVSALRPEPVAAQNFDEVEIRTTAVAGSVHMLQGSGGNIAVSVGDDGTFIVDDQYAPLTEKISEAIAELTDRPVDFVVNTHWHFDHSDGNENFGRAGAVIVAQENSRTRMESDQFIERFDRLQEAYSEVGLPKITFAESIRFHFNGDAIDIVHLGPAHTDGDAVVFFRDSNVLHTGDIFVTYGLPFIDQPNGGTLQGVVEAVEAIAAMADDDTTIVPGHGALATREDLLEYGRMLSTIRDRIREQMDRGRSLEEVVAANPSEGFAPSNPTTRQWVAYAYESLR